MVFKRLLMAGLACVLVVGRAQAQEVLTWADCIKEARLRHPDLISAREKVNAAQADKALTRSGALPQLSASAGADVSKTAGRAKTENYSLGVSGSQLLFDGFKTSNELAAARERVKSAQYNYQVASSDVRLRLRSAFVGLLSAQENVGLTKNIRQRRQQNLDMVALQYQGGREHKGSLMTAEANAAQAGLDSVEAERSVELYQRRLTKELGRSVFAPVKVSGKLSVGTIDRGKPAFEQLVETTPFLKDLTARKEAARFGLKASRSDFFPQVYADAGAGKSDAFWLPRTENWSAGLRVSFPLFAGGQQQAALAKAKAGYRQSEADERSGRDGVILTLAENWTQWLNDVDQALVQDKFYQAARQRADIVEAQYKSGLATFNDWTIIEDDLVRNQKALLQAKTSAFISEAAWLQAKGETVDE
ncbi:MAG: TolC family protein [Candidatus Omnitrophota bacterium]